MSKHVPDRWNDYTSIGDILKKERLVSFKVPLQYAKVNMDLPEDYKLNVEKLLKNLPNLGAVIDLTNTTKYYSGELLESNGIVYKKIYVPGHVIPTSDLRNNFKTFVSEFLDANKDNDKIIGVHCTHGVNRTGFMICDYLVNVLKMKPSDAISYFEGARKHKIERNNYINEIINSNLKINWRNHSRAEDNQNARMQNMHFGKNQHYLPNYDEQHRPHASHHNRQNMQSYSISRREYEPQGRSFSQREYEPQVRSFSQREHIPQVSHYNKRISHNKRQTVKSSEIHGYRRNSTSRSGEPHMYLPNIRRNREVSSEIYGYRCGDRHRNV